ncbi:GNAT family N-acetyltransferase [Enterococcus asini]|uniref:GNAT family N-acetyltransferase n=1 Tax=Enterococcus asini TaxID=57732 RepID=UPI0022E42125|nr:GNAT family N-acetyltransferase [Enterococcus asini]
MEFQTQRCLVRAFEEKDLERFMTYRNNLEWMQYQGFKGLSKEEYAESLLGAANLESGQQFAIVDKASDLLIGDVYLQKAGSEYWLGYTIHPDFARQGLAKEVTLGVLAWLKSHGATKVKAGVLPENQASIGLLKTLGFTYFAEEAGEWLFVYKLG